MNLEGDTATEEHARARSGSATWGRVTLTDDVNLPYLGDTQFAALVFARGIAHTAEVRWATSATSPDALLPHTLTTVRTAATRSVLVDLEARFAEGAIALVRLGRGTFHARIAARERGLVADIEAWLRGTFPVLEPSERRELPVRFWTCGCGTDRRAPGRRTPSAHSAGNGGTGARCPT